MSNALKVTIVLCIFAFLSISAIVANPICVESDAAVAPQAYETCLKNTVLSQQCRNTAVTVSCKRWAFWLMRAR